MDDDEDGIYDLASPAAPKEDEDGVYAMASGAALAPALRQARLDQMVRPRAVENTGGGGGDGSKGRSNRPRKSVTFARSPMTTPSKSDPTCWDPTWDY